MESLWKEELEKIPRWNRKENDGFTTIPRWLPIINRIMDKLSQGKPISSTYLSLWFRVMMKVLFILKMKNKWPSNQVSIVKETYLHGKQE